jgi:hypothetical protein
VIAPVLAALGVYSDKYCVWPPYASRIAFELWQPAVTTASTAAGGKESYIRVIFNGDDVTSLITACKLYNAEENTNHGSIATGLCPLKVFNMQIKNLLQPHSTFADACKI